MYLIGISIILGVIGYGIGSLTGVIGYSILLGMAGFFCIPFYMLAKIYDELGK